MSNNLVHYTGYIPSHYTSDASLVEYQIQQLSQNATEYGTSYILDGILLYNLGKGVTQPNPFPIYTPPQTPQFTLSPGIIYSEQIIDTKTIPTEQILGVGQGMALRLFTDISSHPYGDINVTELRNRVDFSIDENDDLNISSLPGKTFPESDISNILLEGKKIVTMIFNVFDASGWLKQGEKVNLNFIREVSGQGFTIDDNTIFDISGTTSLSVAATTADLSNGTPITNLSYPDDYSIEISNNNLNLKLLDSSYNNYYVKNFSFNVVDISNINYLMSKTDLNFYIQPATVYNLTNNSSFNFIVDYSNNNSDSDNSKYIQVNDQSFVTIGNISIYNYSIQNNHLGPVGGYFNINQINQIEFKNHNNLISLTSNPYKIGKILRV